MERSIKKGDRAKIIIEKIIFNGSGLGKIDNLVCFVPEVIAGEELLVEITAVHKDFVHAKVVEVLTPSPFRIMPKCKHFHQCPGCAYQHLSYEHENTVKAKQLEEFLKHKLDCDNVKFGSHFSKDDFQYRNKITFHISKEGKDGTIGYKDKNGTVFPVEKCWLAHPKISDKFQALLQEPSFIHTLHDKQNLTLRHTANDGVLVWRNSPPSKHSWLKEQLSFGKFSVPLGSFHQINNFGCEMLLDLSRKIIKKLKPSSFIDLFCGSGLFASLAASEGIKEILAIESNPQAVLAAQYNLKQYGISSPQVVGDDVATCEATINRAITPKTLLVVDPPRRGLHKKTIKLLTQSKLQHLIYISCSPDTLARDLQELAKGNFKLIQADMVNMFPRTSHFETFTYLER